MNFLDRMIRLPTIGISELEQRVRSTHSPVQPPVLISSPHHLAKEIQITSPFFEKIKHSPKCECQYHRMKRYQNIISKAKRHTKQQTQGHMHPKTHKCGQQNDNGSLDTLRKGSIALWKSKSAARLLQPLNRSTIAKEGGQQLAYQKKQGSPDKNIVHFKIPKYAKRPSKGTGQDNQKSQVNKSFGPNTEFITLISQRLNHNEYKDNYVKTLFRFIKMKSRQNKLYIWDSRPYIQNSLTILLNHFTMEQLASPQQLGEQQVLKIAYQMGCSLQKVPQILDDLQNVVTDMQEIMRGLRKKKTQLRNLTSMSQSIWDILPEKDGSFPKLGTDGITQILQGRSEDSKGLVYLSGNNPTNLSQDLERNKVVGSNGTKCSLLTDKDEKAPSISPGDTFYKARKSAKQFDFESSTRLKRRDSSLISTPRQFSQSASCNTYSKAGVVKNDSSPESLTKKSNRNSQTLNEKNFGRSPHSTVLNIVNQNEVDCVQEQVVVRKPRKVKGRKARMTKKIVISEYDAKYSHIPYQEYCSKSEFLHLIEEVQRLDRNDQERALAVYNILRMDRFIDRQDKVDHIVQIFQQLVEEGSRKELLKHIVCLRDKKYIDQLTRQLDQVLVEIKKNDPRQLDAEDLFPYRGDPALMQPNNIRFARYKGHLAQRESSLAPQLIDYGAHQTIERHKTIILEQNDKRQLEQAELTDFVLEPIDPNRTEFFSHRKANIVKTPLMKTFKKLDPSSKNVLKYMYSHHNSTFKYLNDQMSKLCSSLPEEDAQRN